MARAGGLRNLEDEMGSCGHERRARERDFREKIKDIVGRTKEKKMVRKMIRYNWLLQGSPSDLYVLPSIFQALLDLALKQCLTSSH